MLIAVWIAVALVCFVLPSVTLTNGGKNVPDKEALAQYAKGTGLPLTDEVAGPVVDRIRRRERGMLIGGIATIVLSGLASIVFDGSERWGALVFVLVNAGMVFGAAWIMATYQPTPAADRPVVARSRSTQLADYLTPGERFGLWVSPVVLLVGCVVGVLLLLRLPENVRGSSIMFGLIGAFLALLTWGLAVLVLRRVLAAPARSGSDSSFAWDDAERALGLRRVANLVVTIACASLACWLFLMADRLTSNGFYREPGQMTLVYLLTGISLAVFVVLMAVLAVGPMRSWITGERKGYEQRRLWPGGVML